MLYYMLFNVYAT